MSGLFDSGSDDEAKRLEQQLADQRKEAERKKKELEDKLKAEDAGRRKGLRGIKSLLTSGETGFEKDKTKLGS